MAGKQDLTEDPFAAAYVDELHKLLGKNSGEILSFITRPQLGPFFRPEIRAFTGGCLQLFPKSVATVKQYSNTKMAVNSR